MITGAEFSLIGSEIPYSCLKNPGSDGQGIWL